MADVASDTEIADTSADTADSAAEDAAAFDAETAVAQADSAFTGSEVADAAPDAKIDDAVCGKIIGGCSKSDPECNWTATGPGGWQGSGNCASGPSQVNGPGEYEVCVTCGAATCSAACTKVLVAPTTDIHVELAWSAPVSATPTATDGADLDLHFAHQLAANADIDCDGTADPWFAKQFDCWWFEDNPQWGAGAGSSPSLSMDSSSAPGLEEADLMSAEGTLQDPHAYSVGVHYCDDHDLGPALATVTVFVSGQEVAKFGPQLLNPLDMWYVGKVHWPNAGLGATVPAVETCWQTGDACLGKSDPADANGGLMWAAKGSACLTRCYKPNGFAPGAMPVVAGCP